MESVEKNNWNSFPFCCSIRLATQKSLGSSPFVLSKWTTAEFAKALAGSLNLSVAFDVSQRRGLIGYILRLMGDIPQEHY